MTEGWSRAHGWESYAAWRRWYRREWGLRSPSPRAPSRGLDGAYRVFSTPDGVETEVVVLAAESEQLVRREARRFLLRMRELVARDPEPWIGAAVVMQVGLAAGRRPVLSCGEVAAPPTAPRRSLPELITLALEDLDG